jgi:hypothetical protein
MLDTIGATVPPPRSNAYWIISHLPPANPEKFAGVKIAL